MTRRAGLTLDDDNKEDDVMLMLLNSPARAPIGFMMVCAIIMGAMWGCFYCWAILASLGGTLAAERLGAWRCRKPGCPA